MKKTLLFVSALLVISALSLSAQPKQSDVVVAALKADITRASNNLNSYEFGEIKDTPAPEGYSPFYISHYGRHGSRSNWGSKDYDNIINALQAAKDLGILTAEGEALMKETQEVAAIFNGMDGRLSQRGVREHEALAMRMYDRYPEVFEGEKKIRSYGSMVQRCLISQNSFTIGLAKKNPKLKFRLDTGEKFQIYINPGDAYRKISMGAYRSIPEYVSKFPEDTVYTAKLLFTNPALAYEKGVVKKMSQLMDNIYQTATVTEDFDLDYDVFRFLPFDAIYKRWLYGNLDLYMHHANSVEYGEKICALAEPAIVDIVEKADEVIASGEYAADLRFGHDHPLLKIVGYLGLEGVGDRWTLEEASDNWLGFYNICMASNLQMIFYRNAENDILVKFLYQEKETKLRNLEPFIGPYYKWDVVKANIKGYLR